MTKTGSLILGSVASLLLLSGVTWHSGQLTAQQAAGSGLPVTEKQSEQTPAGREPETRPRPEDRLLLPPPGVRSFTGRVVKVGGRYLLEDAILGATYDIDPQQAVSAFEGMTVRLTGALDSSGKIIRLQHPRRY